MVETSRTRGPGIPVPAVGMALVIVAAYSALLVIDAEKVRRLGFEDGPIETAGAVFFAVASAGFLIAAHRHSPRRREPGPSVDRVATVCMILAALMFVCLGEELSWGQRLFGWRTPKVVSRLNAQNETNIHNLQAVHQWNPDGTEKNFVEKLINMSRLFSIFWLSVFVVLPLGAATSRRFRVWLARVGIPIPPWWVGALFLTSFLIYKPLAAVAAGSPRAHTLDELKETTYAAVYAVFAWTLCFAPIGKRWMSSSPPSAPDATERVSTSNS